MSLWKVLVSFIVLLSGFILPRPPWQGSGDLKKSRIFPEEHEAISSNIRRTDQNPVRRLEIQNYNFLNPIRYFNLDR